MRCRECDVEQEYMSTEHLLQCSGLTLQEYAIRYHVPLELLVHPQQINTTDSPANYATVRGVPSGRAQAVKAGLDLAGLLLDEESLMVIPGEIRRLDQLLWALQYVREYGFQYKQEYVYDNDSHRVVARNHLKAPRFSMSEPVCQWLSNAPETECRLALAVLISHVAELQAGYLFIPTSSYDDADAVMSALERYFAVHFLPLGDVSSENALLLRSETMDDTRQLLEKLSAELSSIPCAAERFEMKTPEVTVAKELVFDSAHFITDHPAKCSNLHGGRYVLHVKVKGRIDPITGCVIDYGYLKRVVNHRIIEHFDHHTLNYAAGELAWRSSTEMLCVYIWDQLIDYLPGLVELQLYETTQSWCCYQGPSVEQRQRDGADLLQKHFQHPDLGNSDLRRFASAPVGEALRIINQ